MRTLHSPLKQKSKSSRSKSNRNLTGTLHESFSTSGEYKDWENEISDLKDLLELERVEREIAEKKVRRMAQHIEALEKRLKDFSYLEPMPIISTDTVSSDPSSDDDSHNDSSTISSHKEGGERGTSTKARDHAEKLLQWADKVDRFRVASPKHAKAVRDSVLQANKMKTKLLAREVNFLRKQLEKASAPQPQQQTPSFSSLMSPLSKRSLFDEKVYERAEVSDSEKASSDEESEVEFSDDDGTSVSDDEGSDSESVSSEEDVLRAHARKLLEMADQTSPRSRNSSMTTTPPHQPSVAVSPASTMAPKRSPGPDCKCETNVIGESGAFFLPRIGAVCSCGVDNLKLTNPDPESLENVLRDWQVAFLNSLGIRDAPTFIRACEVGSDKIAERLQIWRVEKGLSKAKRPACRIALHIWSRSCQLLLNRLEERYAELDSNS